MPRTQKIRVNAWHVTGLSIVGIVIVFMVLVFVAEQPLYIAVDDRTDADQDVERITDGARMPLLSGMIVDPIDGQGVPNVFLEVEETTIVTRASGRFTFRHVPLATGVKIHHELLQEDVMLKIDDSLVTWYFDPQLYSLLVAIVDSERYGDIADIYMNTAPDVRRAVSQEEFVVQYLPLYEDTVEEREGIVVEQMRLSAPWVSAVYGEQYERAIGFDLSRGDRIRRYWFGFDGELWHYVE